MRNAILSIGPARRGSQTWAACYGLSTAASSMAPRARNVAFCVWLTPCRRSPLHTSQMKSSALPPLPPPLASHDPSGLQATLMTIPPCPCSEARSRPWQASHRKTLPSSQQLASHVPSGLHSTRRTLVGSPRPTHRQVPVVTSHTLTPFLSPPVPSHCPSRLHPTP